MIPNGYVSKTGIDIPIKTSLKVKELKAKDAYKLHVEKAGKAKTDMHMDDDKLKENKDLRKADVEESEGHFKLARKLDLEASVLKKAAMTAAHSLLSCLSLMIKYHSFFLYLSLIIDTNTHADTQRFVHVPS